MSEFRSGILFLGRHCIEMEGLLLGGGVKEPEALVFGAELRCQYGSVNCYLLTEDYASKGINGLPAKFVVTDCIPDVNITPFGDCYAGSLCKSQWMLDDKWINSDGQNETFGGKEIITTASHLVCNASGMFILPVNSGQNSDIGKQLMLHEELFGEDGEHGDLLDFLMNPYNSIYTPKDISQRVLSMLEDIVGSDLYGGSIFLMAQGGHDIMGTIILATIGHLAPSIGVGDPSSLLNGMENMITRTGIRTDADPRNLDAKTLDILRADSVWYAEKVANCRVFNLLEENKLLAAFLADVVNTAAYVMIMSASATRQQRNQGNSSHAREIRDAEIGQSNRGEGVNFRGEHVKRDAAGRWQYYNPITRKFGGYGSVNEPGFVRPVIGPGQIHHVQSNRIMRELNNNPNLRGRINREDPQFRIRAVDLQSHIGYCKHHIARDQQTIDWLRRHRLATYQEYIDHLNDVYSQPAQEARFGRVTFR